MQQDAGRYRDAALPLADAGVSFVMPVLNEARYLERAVRTVLMQDVDGPLELVLALGPSSDATTDIARRLAAADHRIVLVDNPGADIPKGLNAAIRASSHPTVVRVDAHSELGAGYTRTALDALARTRAANIGGVMHAEGRTPFQRAVAHAYNSRIGLGGGRYHGGGRPGPAESAYLGVMRRSVLDEVGLFDESIRRGEDWELNLRIRRAGYRVWFDPRLSVTYWPRESWGRLARQFHATGAWRAELVRRFGHRNSLRFFAPPALVILAVLAVAVGVLQVLRVVVGVVAAAVSVVYVPLIAYAVLVVAACSRGYRGAGFRERLWLAAILPTMHIAWGAGFLTGLVTGAGGTVDTSRLGSRNTPLP